MNKGDIVSNTAFSEKKIYPNLFMIVAMTEKTNSIGLNGDMLYHLKDDLRYYKEKTQNHNIICGRKTYFSFPIRPLPNRTNIVLTTSEQDFDGCITMSSLDDVLDYVEKRPDEYFFVSGGENIYRQFMDYSSKLYITIIDEKEDVISDTVFPEIDNDIWEVKSISEYIRPDSAPNYRYFIFDRK